MIFKNAMIFFGGDDMSGDSNETSLDFQAESIDDTRFGMSTRVKKGGLKTGKISGKGFFDGAGAIGGDEERYGGGGGLEDDEAAGVAFPEADIDFISERTDR